MGFTNVAWESRSTEQLARDLTEGAGPTSVTQAGAAWVRVADELAGVSADYDNIVDIGVVVAAMPAAYQKRAGVGVAGCKRDEVQHHVAAAAR